MNSPVKLTSDYSDELEQKKLINPKILMKSKGSNESRIVEIVNMLNKEDKKKIFNEELKNNFADNLYKHDQNTIDEKTEKPINDNIEDMHTITNELKKNSITTPTILKPTPTVLSRVSIEQLSKIELSNKTIDKNNSNKLSNNDLEIKPDETHAKDGDKSTTSFKNVVNDIRKRLFKKS